MKVIILALLVIGPALLLPAFAQVSETHTIIENSDGSVTFMTHDPYVADSGGYYHPYILAQDSDHVQVKIAGGKISIDKNECAGTYFDQNENIIIKSETYNVRTATIDTNDWSHLDVNNVACSVTVLEQDEGVIVTLSKENGEGLFDLEYIIKSSGIKTTAFFNNQLYENNKFAFTQSVQLLDPIIELNDQEYDLRQLRGQNFDRETLEQNADLVFEAKNLFFNAGLGFDQLWNVNISDSDITQINLDYANQGENQTAIGETLELDPTITMIPGGLWTAGGSTSSECTDNGGNWSSGSCYFPGSLTTHSKDLQDADNDGTCSNTPSSVVEDTGNFRYEKVGVPASTASYDCTRIFLEWDTTPIHDNAQITDVDVTLNWGYASGTARDCDFMPLSNQPTASSFSTIFSDIGTGTPYLASNSDCVNLGTNLTQDLGTSADSDLESRLSSDWFAFGIKYQNETIDSSNHITELNDAWASSTPKPTLIVTYDAPPDPPTGLAVSWNNPNVDLSWAAPSDPGSSAVSGYKIERSTDNVTWSTVVADTGNTNTTYQDSSITFSVGSTYYYRIYAINSTGLSYASTSASTLIANAPDQVTGVTAQDGVPIIIDWTAPNDNGSAITNYEIHRDGSLLTTVGNVLTYSDSSVVGGTTYSYQIGAVNSIGTGTLSASVSALAGVPPDPPTSLSSSIPNNATAPLDIKLDWTLPGNTGTASLSDIKIERSTNNTTWTPLTTLFTGSGSSVSFTDQVGTPGQYYYRVYAVSPHGTSIASNDTNSTTSDVPDAPVLSGTIINDTQIDLEWTTPNSSSDLINYRLTQNGVDILQPSVGTNSHSVTGLTPGGTYDFIVYAKNYVGDSVGSNTIQLTTYITPTGTLTATVNQIGATLEIVPSFTLTGGTPVPSFTNISLYEGGVLKKTVPYGTFYYHLPDGGATALELRINDSSHWANPTFVYNFTATSTYIPNWDSNNVSHDITRANNLFNIIVNWDTTIPFDMTCEYKTSTQAIDKTAGISSTGTGLWAFQDSGVAINDGTHVYGECTSNNQTVLTFTSYGPNLILAGAGLLNQHSGDFLGVPAVMIFIIAIAGLFTGRSANTGILVILSVIGIAGFLGFMIIDQATWGFILIAGVLGLFVGRRFL